MKENLSQRVLNYGPQGKRNTEDQQKYEQK